MTFANLGKLWASASIRGLAIVGLLLIPGSIAILSGSDASPNPFQGIPFYPDLQALAPSDLYLSTEILEDGQSHNLLRFSTSVSNIGEGPLELQGSTVPGSEGAVSQVITDAPFGGKVVDVQDLGIDLISHPAHHHFHLDHFATYELLFEDSNGDWVPTGSGGKQSSCVLDNFNVGTDGPQDKGYSSCTLERQGLSVGWTDTYAASLPDQWIDIGPEQLADGSYTIRYVVDPLAQISEDGRIENNIADTRFDVQDGALVGLPEPPRCTIEGSSIGVPGDLIHLTCSHFHKETGVAVYWDAWDPWDTSGAPVATFIGQGATESTVSFVVPIVPPGAYTVAVVAFDPEAGRYVSTTVIFGVDLPNLATPVPVR